MTPTSRRAFVAGGAVVVLGVQAQTESARWFDTLEREQGRFRYRFLGFDAYEAVLKVGSGFQPAQWQRFPMALSLTYARDIRGVDIVRRSIEEIERQTGLSLAQRQLWQSQLNAVLPDVFAGDTLLGAYRPEQSLQLWRQRITWQPLGEVADVELSRRFMGIWLSPQTSEPDMRQALLGLSSTYPRRSLQKAPP